MNPGMIGRVLNAPSPVGREQGRELARRELQNPIYQRDQPSVLDRVLQKINDWLEHLLRIGNVSGGSHGSGWTGLIILIVVLILVAAVIWWRTGGLRRGAAERGPLLDDRPTTAKDHRTEADRYARQGDWPNAIRERLRAIARDLEERAIVDHHPGRTADELADEAGAELPDHAEELAAGVRIFDDVWYGGRRGSEDAYRRITALDERLRSARPAPVGAAR